MQTSTDKKVLILEAAEVLFHRYGYSKTSLEDIAKEAGLGKGTIYYYFESKEDIFFEVAQQHSDKYFQVLKDIIASEKSFEEKFSLAIRTPIRLVYEHTPLLLDAIKNLPRNYLHRIDAFRDENRKRMIELLNDVIQVGVIQNLLTDTIPVEKLVNIIFDWFLLGDSNVIIQYPEEFIRKAEIDYEFIVSMILHGILKRGDSK
jgi:AcrR family transcriptional regulator